ncbi:hypothetical protein MMC31_000925, partial [Peltigera leucophlebia]|nr:hypothetical protein [Peltigera leucophlebia]
MVNITICGRVLEAHRPAGKSRARDEKKEVNLQPKDLIKISGLTENTTESCNMLIKELSLLGVNVKIGKNGIVELDGKDPALSTSPSTFLPARQSPFSFPAPLDFVPETVHRPLLSTKPPKEDTPKLQSEETTHPAGWLASNPEHARFDTFPPQCHGSPPTLASAPQPLPSTTLANLPLGKEVTEPNSWLENKAPEADPSVQYEDTNPDPDPSIQHQEATGPNHSLLRKVSKPDYPPHHKTTEPDLSLQHKTKPNLSPKHEAAGNHISPQQVATEPDLLVQHEAAKFNLPLQHKAANTDPSLKSDATGTHTLPQQEPGLLGQLKAAKPNLSFQYKAAEPDFPLRHKATKPDASPQHEATEHNPSLQHNATESNDEAFHVPARAPKRRCKIWLVETPAGVKRKAVARGATKRKPRIIDGGSLSLERLETGHKAWVELPGMGKILFERIEEIWDARKSSEKLLSLKSRHPSWFTNTQDSTATSAKSNSTPTARESGAKEERFKNGLTPTACISGNEKRNSMK